VTAEQVPQPGAAVLAIDGGNSKTDLALIAADGRVLATARGGGSNYQNVGTDRAVAVLRSLVAAAAEEAGLPATGHIAVHTSACLAGADLPDEEADLTALVHAQGWSHTSSVVNDTFAVLRSGLDDAAEHWGIGVTCGAGINCVGVAPDGATTRFLSLGSISGDWGGGGQLSMEALFSAVRAEDGRGKATALQEAVAAHFDVAEVRDVTIGLHLGKIPYGDLHGLVPLLFRVAGQGDEVAADLVIRQADEICLMVTVAARRLGLTDSAVPVALGGSVLRARDPLLSSRITERLSAELTNASLRIVDVPPIVGAGLLGLDHVGADPAAAATLRAAYLDMDAAVAGAE
jgi:N-acetylglucosamine kinase-like BadF-type ATPase